MVSAHPVVPRPLWYLSAILAAAHVAMTWSYVDTRFRARPLGDGQVSIVRYIESLGPFWAIGFAASGVAIAVALWLWPSWLWKAHVLGATVMSTYGAAAWMGAWLSRPLGPIQVGVLATTLALVHGIAVWVASRVIR